MCCIIMIHNVSKFQVTLGYNHTVRVERLFGVLALVELTGATCKDSFKWLDPNWEIFGVSIGDLGSLFPLYWRSIYINIFGVGVYTSLLNTSDQSNSFFVDVLARLPRSETRVCVHEDHYQ